MHRLWDLADIKIGVDGGAHAMVSQQKFPDFIIGDLDSWNGVLPKSSHTKIIRSDEDEDTNDLEKTVRWCLNQKIRQAHVVGASGKRSDHFLANLEVLYRYASVFPMTFWTETESLWIVEGSWEAELPVGQVVSLLPLFGSVDIKDSVGWKYPLPQGNWGPGIPPCGLSNEVISSVSIHLKQGKLLLVANHIH